MKNTFVIALSISALAISVLALGLSVTDNKKQGYVVNRVLFDEFKGTVDLKRKLDILHIQNQRLVDSLSLYPENQQLRSLYSESLNNMEELANRYTEDIWAQLNKDISDFARENNYDIIWGANGSGSLMYADSSLNITPLLIEYSNKQYEGN